MGGSVSVALRGTIVSMLAVIVFTELAGVGRLRLEHLSAYFAALGVAFIGHYAYSAFFGNREEER